MQSLRLVALVCGLGPLAIGVVIFALWLITRDITFPILGFMLIFPLLAAIAVGLVAWVGYGIAGLMDRDSRPERFWDTFASSGCMLLVNFPVAFCMFLATIILTNQYRVEVRNEGPLPLQSVAIHGDGGARALGPIEAGQRARGWVWGPYEGSVSLMVRGEFEPIDLQLDRFSSGMPIFHEKIVTIHSDGSTSMMDRNGIISDWLYSDLDDNGAESTD